MIFETKQTMTNRGDWEKAGKKNACRICGQFIDNNEEFYRVIVGNAYASLCPDFIVHVHEWEVFKEGITEVSAIIEKLSVNAKPNTQNHTVPDIARAECFLRHLNTKGFITKKETANRVYFQLPGSPITFYFEKRFEVIVNNMLEKISRLEEAWKKELGETVEDEFSAEKYLNNLEKQSTTDYS